MKKIALLMDGWKRFFTYAWPAGILQRIQETQEEVNLYIFNSSGDWSRDDAYNIGEYNIFSLPDLNDFDGIILDLNNIRYEKVCNRIVEAARQTGKPVISIAQEMNGFYYVGIDNYDAMHRMIEHLYEVHQCRNYWFIVGPKDNYENRIRVQALKNFVNYKGLQWGENNFYSESYEYDCGVHGFAALYERNGGKLPDAIVCANDNIAVGVCETAEQYGYHVPADFCVTGFDNFDKASYFDPKITTVGHIREEVGYRCADLLLRIWRGEKTDRFNFTDTECIFWESCGCTNQMQVDERKHAKEQIMYDLETADFEEQVLSLEYELLNCKTVAEMSHWIPKCIPSMKCDAMYLILDDHLNDFKKQKDSFQQQLFDDEGLHKQGYPENMTIEFAYENGHMVMKDKATIQSLFPLFDYPEGNTDFLFLPLHFRDKTVGFFVIRHAVYLMEKQYLFKIVNVLTSAMENLHKKEKLEYMNQILSEMTVRDAMTGLYNRLGYQQLACKLFDEKKQRGEDLLIMFVDMDRLKYINDHFGHEYGDYAIQSIAKAIHDHMPYGAIPVRTGGDEFLIILDLISKDREEQIIEQIREDIKSTAKKKELPFPLSFSIGCIRTDMKTDKSLDEYISEADEIMYEEKAIKNANRKE